MNRSRWALIAASTTVLAVSWTVAGALGNAAPPDLGSRIMVDPFAEPAVADDDRLGGVRVIPDGIDGATKVTDPVGTPPPAAEPDPPPAPPAPPPPVDDDDDDDDPDDEPAEPDEGDDDAGDG